MNENGSHIPKNFGSQLEGLGGATLLFCVCAVGRLWFQKAIPFPVSSLCLLPVCMMVADSLSPLNHWHLNGLGSGDGSEVQSTG